MIGTGDADRDPNGDLMGDAGLSRLLTSGDGELELEPDDESECSSAPSVLDTDLEASVVVALGFGGEGPCFPELGVN